MADTILCIFEGARTEKQVFESIEKTFFRNASSICTVYYGTDIYQLWRELAADEFLDITEVLRERNPDNEQALAKRTRDDFSEVHLFFDYDGHATMADDETIAKMLMLFQNETEQGKLYVSYPMVEALKDLDTSLSTRSVPAKKNIRYKTQLERSPYQDLRNLTATQWHDIIEANQKKATFIITQDSATLACVASQELIFAKQREYYIEPKSEVAVLSGIPFFIIDYFEDYTKHLQQEDTH